MGSNTSAFYTHLANCAVHVFNLRILQRYVLVGYLHDKKKISLLFPSLPDIRTWDVIGEKVPYICKSNRELFQMLPKSQDSAQVLWLCC